MKKRKKIKLLPVITKMDGNAVVRMDSEFGSKDGPDRIEGLETKHFVLKTFFGKKISFTLTEIDWWRGYYDLKSDHNLKGLRLKTSKELKGFRMKPLKIQI